MLKLNSTNLSTFVKTDVSLFILRVFGAGFMLFGHGWPKVVNIFNGNFQFLDPLGIGAATSLIIAAVAECVGSIMIMIGFYTRLAALVLIGNMTVVFLFVQLGKPFTDASLQLGLLYLLVFVSIFLLGPGKLSIDANTSH